MRDGGPAHTERLIMHVSRARQANLEANRRGIITSENGNYGGVELPAMRSWEEEERPGVEAEQK